MGALGRLQCAQSKYGIRRGVSAADALQNLGSRVPSSFWLIWILGRRSLPCGRGSERYRFGHIDGTICHSRLREPFVSVRSEWPIGCRHMSSLGGFPSRPHVSSLFGSRLRFHWDPFFWLSKGSLWIQSSTTTRLPRMRSRYAGFESRTESSETGVVDSGLRCQRRRIPRLAFRLRRKREFPAPSPTTQGR